MRFLTGLKIYSNNIIKMIGDKKVITCKFNNGKPTFEKGWKDNKTFKEYNECDEENALMCGMWIKNSKGEKFCHENAIIVVDLDFYKPKNGWDDITEHPFIKKFGEDFVKKFKTFTVKTKSGGYHLYFNYDKRFDKTSINQVREDGDKLDIDIISNNSLLFSPRCENYEVVKNKSIKDIPDDLSEWLLEGMKQPLIKDTGSKSPKKENVKVEKVEADQELIEICNNIDEEYIDDYRDWLKIIWACASMDNRELGAMISKRGDKWDEESYNKHYDKYEEGRGITKAVLYYYSKMSNQDKHFKIMKKYHQFNEIENPEEQEIALTFCKFYGTDFIINDKKEYYFNGIFWENKSVENKIKLKLIEDLKQMYKKMLQPPTTEEVMIRNKKINKIIKYLGTSSKVKAIYDFIKVYIANEDIKFDEKPNIFCFKNKCYDLHTNEWIEPNKFDYVSQSTRRPFIKPMKEDIQKLKDELIKIFPNEEERTLYMTVLATSLYGKTLEKFTVANGSGGNGKGYLNELMMFMMGDYAINADCSIVLGNGKPKDGPNAELASIAKKRLVIMTEPNEKQKINIAVVKKMTGGDTITARACHSNKTEHNIYLTLIMECNKKPQMDGRMDKAILRRILDIPFRATFTDDPSQFEGEKYIYEGDSNAKSRENKMEQYSPLFVILIEYWKMYQKNNMKLYVPESIQKRNIEYMKASDDILQFMETNYEKTDNKDDYVKFKDVFQQYKYIVYKKMQRKQLLEKIIENEFLDYRKRKKINGKDLDSIILGYKMKEDDEEDSLFFKPNPKFDCL